MLTILREPGILLKLSKDKILCVDISFSPIRMKPELDFTNVLNMAVEWTREQALKA